MAMGKNLDKNINIEELKAQAEKRKQDAELELQRVEQLQQEQKEAEKQQKIDERQALLDNVATFMAQSRQEAFQEISQRRKRSRDLLRMLKNWHLKS
jgi:response regulator RpfG family c-di-GMP phosphodiesterase